MQTKRKINSGRDNKKVQFGSTPANCGSYESPFHSAKGVNASRSGLWICQYVQSWKKKKDTPTISELCRGDKKPFQPAAKAVCSNGLYARALQQLKRLPQKALAGLQCPVLMWLRVTNKRCSQGSPPQSAVWAGQKQNTLWHSHGKMTNWPLSPFPGMAARASKHHQLHNENRHSLTTVTKWRCTF